MLQEQVIQPPLGLRLQWQGQALRRLELFWTSAEHALYARLSPEASTLQEFLQTCLQGQVSKPPALNLAWELVPPFSRLVLGTLQSVVKPGQCIAYSELAAMCCRPEAARAVGQAMHNNPWPLLIPCHRVLARNKKLGGFSSGLDMKRFLLGLEGIAFKE